MLVCSLKGINVQLCRRVSILANNRLQLIAPVTKPVEAVIRRGVHNSLYQKVKKSTLEACTKAEAKKLPQNQAGLSNRPNVSKSSKLQPPSICVSSPPKSTSPPPSISNSTIKSKSQDITKEATCRPIVSTNAEVLRAVNCNVSRKDAEAKGGDGSGASSMKGNDNSDKIKTILMALAAALGLGGIVLYFLGGNKPAKECKPIPVINPIDSSVLPKHVPYLLIGGGAASFSAFRAIKSNDARAKVLMITDEYRMPYMRPPLSKELWYSAQETDMSKDYRFKQWTGAERSLYFEPEEFFVKPDQLSESVNGGIAVAQGFKVKKIDPSKRVATLSDGYEIGYDECLIATGCSPKNLPVFADAPPSIMDKVMVYRTPEDFERLKRYVDGKKNITIVGNGFIGSELACSLASYTKPDGGRIFQIFPESGNMSKVLPDYLSKWTMKKVESQGVCVLPNANIKDVKRDDSSLKLMLSTGDTIMSDIVVVCVGCEANTDIAYLSGLEVDKSFGGFVVNAELEARRNLFVAGDASCFYDPLLGRRRVEHHDHSVVSGRLAGENMVGKKKPYNHQSMFWSDLGPEIGYEGIGLVDSSLPTVGVFSLPSKAERKTDNLTENPSVETKQSTSLHRSDTPDVSSCEDNSDNYGRGVIFYLKDEKIVGILLWNIFNRIGLARTIINQNKKYDDLNEVAKLFEIHS